MPGGVDGGSWELELDPDPDPNPDLQDTDPTRSCLDPDRDPGLTSVEGPSRPPGSPSSDFNPLAPGSKVPGLYCPPPSVNYSPKRTVVFITSLTAVSCLSGLAFVVLDVHSGLGLQQQGDQLRVAIQGCVVQG